jgi:hypothetical protein
MQGGESNPIRKDSVSINSSMHDTRGTWAEEDDTLLEKRSIVTPWIHYWYRLITVADINIGGLPVDTNSILLIAAILRRPIPKINVLFDIGLLSGPTPIL